MRYEPEERLLSLQQIPSRSPLRRWHPWVSAFLRWLH